MRKKINLFLSNVVTLQQLWIWSRVQLYLINKTSFPMLFHSDTVHSTYFRSSRWRSHQARDRRQNSRIMRWDKNELKCYSISVFLTIKKKEQRNTYTVFSESFRVVARMIWTPSQGTTEIRWSRCKTRFRSGLIHIVLG